jgi:hypothetical protein
VVSAACFGGGVVGGTGLGGGGSGGGYGWGGRIISEIYFFHLKERFSMLPHLSNFWSIMKLNLFLTSSYCLVVENTVTLSVYCIVCIYA